MKQSPSKEKFPTIKCPWCSKDMEVGYNRDGSDYYCQCRNLKCPYDGWTAGTLEELQKGVEK